ncbi:MAG: AraC family transcriptional regulator [Pseudolabrys sp.]
MSDVLSDIFNTIRLRGTLYFRTDYSPPWAIAVPALTQAARFHLVAQGRCHVRLESGRAFDLGAGDLILIPRGQAHVLADRADRKPAPLEKVLQQSGYNGRGAFVVGKGDPAASTQLVCGHFTFAEGADHPLLRALPDAIVVTSADRARYPLLDEALRLVVRLALVEELGAAASIARLSEMFFIETVRISSERIPELGRVLKAMTDRHVGRALELIHNEPGKPWTVQTLAAQVGMSRSRFADRFSELMGDGPMSYLADWRLQRALVLLGRPRANVQQVAHDIGYQSAAAFTRAFSQKFGLPPSGFRREA